MLNRKVSAPRLGHAYSVHGITGSLGWALAPAMMVPLALAYLLARGAGMAAGALAFAVLAVLWLNRDNAGCCPRAPRRHQPQAGLQLPRRAAASIS